MFRTGENRHGVRAIGGPERLTVYAGKTIRTYQPDPEGDRAEGWSHT